MRFGREVRLGLNLVSGIIGVAVLGSSLGKIWPCSLLANHEDCPALLEIVQSLNSMFVHLQAKFFHVDN